MSMPEGMLLSVYKHLRSVHTQEGRRRYGHEYGRGEHLRVCNVRALRTRVS